MALYLKDMNGNTVRVPNVSSTSWFKKACEEPEEKAKEIFNYHASQLVDMINIFGSFLPAYSPFNQSLKKIYGKDFFNDVQITDGMVYLSLFNKDNTSGDIRITRMPCGYYPYIISNPVKILASMFDNQH